MGFKEDCEIIDRFSSVGDDEVVFMVNDGAAWDLGHKTGLSHKCCEGV